MTFEEPLTLTLSPEYRGEGTGHDAPLILNARLNLDVAGKVGSRFE
jgi:hypothetical protein